MHGKFDTDLSKHGVICNRPRRSSIFCWPGSNVIYVTIFTQTISYYYLNNSATTVADIIFQRLLFSVMIDYSEEATNKK